MSVDPSKLILLIEDNQDDEELTIRALRKNQIQNEITVARDGAEAVSLLFSDGAQRPHIVLLDLNLPKLNGFEVLKRIRADERTALLPVVVFTSSKEDEDIVDSYALGANGYVRKPVEFQQFMETIKALGIYWLALNEPPPEN
jgi:two-component system, response regulator